MGGAVVAATPILDEEVADEDEDTEAAEEIIMTIMIILKILHVKIATKRVTITWTARRQRKMEIKTQTWFQKQISKICFNPRLRKCSPKGRSRKRTKPPPI
jgi:hypothetical protein